MDAQEIAQVASTLTDDMKLTGIFIAIASMAAYSWVEFRKPRLKATKASAWRIRREAFATAFIFCASLNYVWGTWEDYTELGIRALVFGSLSGVLTHVTHKIIDDRLTRWFKR